jgi:protein-S-isoprenylcysteine O-methyltransferase Ste14
MISGAVIGVPSLPGAILIVVSGVFFDRKSAYEEALLADAYPGYDDYRRRVRWKLLPGLR